MYQWEINMSFLSGILSKVETWFQTSPIGQTIEADAKAALSELEKVSVADLENVVTLIGTTVLANLATGGTAATAAGVGAAIEAGIAAAIPAFKAVGADVASKTVTTLVSTVVNQLAPHAASVTPAAPAA